MSSVVSGTVGYNFYLDGVKVNDALVPVDGSFSFEGLASNTDYSITSTSVDAAGNESIPSVAVVGATAKTVHVDSPLSDADKLAVDAIVAASMLESSQPGVIVSITGPRGYYSKAYGNTAATGGRPLTVDDHFRMGSVTKTFTATAFWMQVDQGLVSLDDTLDMYVSGVPSGNLITIRDMMQMRSGVFDYQSDLMVQIIFSIFPTYTFSEAGALGIIRGNASQFTPGTSYAYTNSNYVLLGAVVEAVTGRKIKDILTEDILVPLGLTETQWPSSSAIPVPAASAGAVNPELFGAAGALTTTVGDLAKWAQAMRDGTLISDSSRALWLETGFYGYPSGMSDPPPALFGYGMGMISLGTWLGHDGSVPGFSTACVFDSVSGATIAVSENAQTTAPVVLAAWTRIFHSIGAYLYPGSMVDQVYAGAGVLVRPTGVSLSITRGSPTVSVTALGVKVPTGASLSITRGTPTVSLSDNQMVTPTGVVLRMIGGSPGFIAEPASASLTITGYRPDVTVATPYPTYGATGTGGSSTIVGSNPTAVTSGTHTPAAGDNIVIISVGLSAAAASGTTMTVGTISVTYGGVAATASGTVATQPITASSAAKAQEFYFLNPPAGASTINVSVPITGLNLSSANSGIFMESTSYSGGGVPTTRVVASAASGTASSVVAGTVPAGSIVRFTHLSAGISLPNISAYNQTQRKKLGPTGRTLMLVGDAVGAGASITSTATQTSSAWIASSYIIPPA